MQPYCELICLAAPPTTCAGRRCLIRQSAQGDRAALELLFERLYGHVHRQARQLTHGGADADDLTQDALALAFEGLGRLRSPALIRRWLRTITWNRHLEMHRRPDVTGMAVEFDEAAHLMAVRVCATPMDRVLWKEQAGQLKRAIGKLPPTLSEAFLHRVLHQRSTRDTAGILGISEEAVRTRLRRARLELREAIEVHRCR